MAEKGYKESKTFHKKIDTNKAGYNAKDKNVFNSVDGLVDSDLKNIDFIKDPEKLLYQYKNLIYSLGRYYAKEFNSEADIQDLFSYISDTFISLVLEYDKNSGVDFPGYIDRSLRSRVKYSYVNKIHNKSSRMILLKNDTTDIEDILAAKQLAGDMIETDKQGNITYVPYENTGDFELIELMDEIASMVSLSELDKLVIVYLYKGFTTPKKLASQINRDFNGEYSYKEIKKSYLNLKNFLALHYSNKLK